MELRGLSQRALASRVGLSFKGLQLLEQPGHDPKLGTLQKVVRSLGLPSSGLIRVLEGYLTLHPDSVSAAALRIPEDGLDPWRIHLFHFVDAFRASRDPELIRSAPPDSLDPRLRCLTASTVESLCQERAGPPPGWCLGIGPLPDPWFVAGVENLKAQESVNVLTEGRIPAKTCFLIEELLPE